MTVTSERHTQAQRTKKQKGEENATSWGGSDKDRAQDDVLRHGGAPLVVESGVGRLLSMSPILHHNDDVWCVCITKREKAKSEAQRGKPKGTLEREIRSAISVLEERSPR